MAQRITLTINDYNRLLSLLRFPSRRPASVEFLSKLHNQLSSATTVEQHVIDRRVVTMNSRVHLKDIITDRQSEVTLTYPHEAEPRDGKISVLSEPGIALLGKQESDIVTWKAPGKLGQFEIVKVSYQPEAAKHYYL